MDTVLYPIEERMNPILKKLKASMKLDFTANDSRGRANRINNLILSSPDVQRLVLASPEMERILNLSNFSAHVQDNSNVYNTANVTEDQEAFVMGFMSALKRVKNADTLKQGVPTTGVPAIAADNSLSFAQLTNASTNSVITHSSSLNAKNAVVVASVNAFPNVHLTSLPQLLSPESSNSSRHELSPPPIITNQEPAVPIIKNFLKDVQIKEEPQTVPDVHMHESLAPIDLDNQERIKLDRKRARNRVAAQKCRTRKIQRIQMLQEQSNALKHENTVHKKTMNNLQNDIMVLKQEILRHQKIGCAVAMS